MSTADTDANVDKTTLTGLVDCNMRRCETHLANLKQSHEIVQRRAGWKKKMQSLRAPSVGSALIMADAAACECSLEHEMLVSSDLMQKQTSI